jgi:LPXTG-motif cell wall-anchored protein
MRRLALTLASVLALAVAGIASADVTFNSATPQIEPVILGDVTSVTAHTVTVSTGSGEQMAFEFDSRTVKPTELQVGDPVRVEFRLLESGLHFAQRVTTLTPGSLDWDALKGQRTAANTDMYDKDKDNDNDRDDQVNQANGAGSVSENTRERNEMGTDTNHPEPATSTNETPTTQTTDQSNSDHDNLPATASEMPWVLAIGVLLLAVAFGMWLARRRWA